MTDQPGRRRTTPEPGASGTSGWVVWVALAGVLLALLGTFHLVQGIGALVAGDRFWPRDSSLLDGVSDTAWGWVHVVTGLVTLLAGFFVFAGRRWARAVGVVVAVLSALASLSFLATHPVGALCVIALDVVVVVALVRHGSEIRAGG